MILAMITTITGKNQITVPSAIVEKAHLHPGTRLDWEIGVEGQTLGGRHIVGCDGEKSTILRLPLNRMCRATAKVRGSGRKHKKRGASAVANLIVERGRDDREGR